MWWTSQVSHMGGSFDSSYTAAFKTLEITPLNTVAIRTNTMTRVYCPLSQKPRVPNLNQENRAYLQSKEPTEPDDYLYYLNL